MEKIEIKKFGVLNTLKVTMYMSILPVILCFLMGIGIALLGVFTRQKQMIFMGALMGLLYPIVLIVMYGVMSMLMALIYNLFASKFGGLELTIKEDETTQTH